MVDVSRFLSQPFIDDTQSLEEVNIGGFTTLVRVRENYTLESEVPETVLEDGSSTHDHVILRPMRLSIEGDVADIHLRSSPALAVTQGAQREIGNLTSQFAPARTQSQVSKINALANTSRDAVTRIQNVVNAGEQAARVFMPDSNKSNQEQFIDFMGSVYFGRQLIDVEMPFRTHSNMRIVSFQALTDNEADSTGFIIEAVQLQFTRLETAIVRAPSPGLKGQLDAPVSQGSQAGETVTDASFIANVRNLFK